MPEDPRVGLSCRAYAKRRGVGPMSVVQAIRSGRLRASVVRGDPTPTQPLGPVLGISDPFLADKEWEANSDMSKAPAAVRERAAALSRSNAEALAAAGLEEPAPLGEVATLADQVKLWDARLKELKYREAAGELVRVSDAKKKVADMIGAAKSRLLSIPSRLKQDDPTLTLAQVAAVEDRIREALADLATGALWRD